MTKFVRVLLRPCSPNVCWIRFANESGICTIACRLRKLICTGRAFLCSLDTVALAHGVTGLWTVCDRQQRVETASPGDGEAVCGAAPVWSRKPYDRRTSTGAIRASACSRTQQPLRCSQREHVLRSDVSNAAYRTFVTRIRVIAIAGRGSILISRYAQVDCSATRVQAEHRRCAFPSRLRAPGTAPSTSVGRPAERPRSATTRRCSAPGRWSSH